ncbi:TetR/AcrR family transcriptional regulator [Actinoallomurus sp. CA-150999]|uniref:TetR/AcrR family transcriptional regulator n=1 Tax=Actinoallomurus sp. CA-150999 TaxID=3239887 RepID=UPI003D90FC64
MPDTGPRPLRADARRNRERLLEAAVRAFAEEGTDATLDAIAKDAGVGIGTLYRHFPTREALVEAAYRNEVARLCDAAPDLLRTAPPDEAMRAWMDRFIDYMAAKRHMSDALHAIIASGGNPFSESRARMMTATETLLKAGAAAGTLRPDVDPMAVLTSLIGVSLATREPDRHDRAGSALDLLMDGLRYRPTD